MHMSAHPRKPSARPLLPLAWLAAAASILLWLAAPAQARDTTDADQWTPDTVVPLVAARSDPTEQYALYLPPDYSPRRRWPVLVLLDPRGQAEATVRLALQGARRNGWIVLSSYQSRSDTIETYTLKALQALLGEALQRYPSDPKRVYLAGFSGTSMTLWTRMAQLNPLVAGVIGSGGAHPPEMPTLGKPPAAFFGFTGTRDFNYQHMRDLDAELAEAGGTHRLQVFTGTHGWPPADAFGDAIDWLELMAMRDGRAPRREDWIDGRLAGEQARMASSQGLERWRRLDQMVRDYRGLRDVTPLQAEADALSRQPEVRGELARERRLHGEEADAATRLDNWKARLEGHDQEARRAMAEAMPELRIDTLKALAAGDDAALADSAHRRLELILAFTSFYLPEQFVADGDVPRAVALLELSLAIDPAQPGPHWRLAQLHAQAGRKDKAFAELQAARALGYVNTGDLQRNAVWDAMRDDPRWAAAATALEKK